MPTSVSSPRAVPIKVVVYKLDEMIHCRIVGVCAIKQYAIIGYKNSHTVLCLKVIKHVVDKCRKSYVNIRGFHKTGHLC